jgi:Dynamin family
MAFASDTESLHRAVRSGSQRIRASSTDEQETVATPLLTRGNTLDELRRARLELEFAVEGRASFSPVLRALRRIETWLSRPPRIAISGEFNCGKSTLVNMLIGVDAIPTAVVSNTCIPTLLYFAREPSVTAVHHDGKRHALSALSPMETAGSDEILRLEVGLPSERLRRMQILDLPGLDDPNVCGAPYELSQHHADAVVWCTVATQAWKESERTAWLDVPGYLRERGILLATFADLLGDADDQRSVFGRLTGEAGPHFREIVMVSAKAAQDGQDAAGDDGSSRGCDEILDDDWGQARLNSALDRVIAFADEQRVAAALALVGRLARHTLKRLDTEIAVGEQQPSLAS